MAMHEKRKEYAKKSKNRKRSRENSRKKSSQTGNLFLQSKVNCLNTSAEILAVK